MEEGYMPDQVYLTSIDARWSKRFSNSAVRKVQDAEHVIYEEESQKNRKITSYRCKKCGYLESYAK